MSPTSLALGVVLVIAGAAILRFNRRVGAGVAAMSRDSNDPRYSLLNRERAERIQEAEGDEGLNRVGVVVLGLMLVVAGGFALAEGSGLA